MEYRLLKYEEWERAESSLATFGQKLPHKDNSLLSIAEHDGQIAGILCFHPVLHGEPFWVHESYRGLVDIRRLQQSLVETLPAGLEYYAFTPSRKMRWVAGTCGMKLLPWDVWKGVV
jgi:hypothetical protein